ncbi:relaxase [Acidiferrobacter sp. SPIII_3]|uniref:MobF family relaxase n=1 Tax=Acidiferrobacter sp. SPIII_3 TaxID=1281578 RepID=UPI000D732E7D|nr:MobF family relaxase [Acidiferrobacter sp. SPIII_3]AWP23795.1 relaxase [Acidiferrobacter sp. SPIII_3]
MLRIKPLKSGRAAAGIADYLEHRKEPERAVGYYENKTAPSAWLGQGAAALGLEGAVDRAQLIALLEGRLPDGTDLSARGGRQDAARRGTDLTLSASKSYSLLATADPRLVALWDESVKVAAGVIERECATARRGHGGTQIEQTGRLVLATYRHEDARTVDGIPDPDLHTHCLAVNMTKRADGQWVRMDLAFGERAVLAKTADFAQKAWLAQEVQKLGYAIRITPDGWEFAAVPDEILSMFSRRSQQIDAALRARGIDPETATDAQKEAACLATRGSKSQAAQSEQRWEWRARLRAAGLDMDGIVAQAHTKARDTVTPLDLSAEIVAQAHTKARDTVTPLDLSAEAVKSATRHLGERDSVFSKHQTRLEALRAGMGGATLDQIDQALCDKAAGLIDVGAGRLTTLEALYREQEILARARGGAGAATPLMSDDQADSFMAARERAQGFAFSAGQREALALALTSPDRVTGIVGAAGAGKTTSMAGFVEAAKAHGYEVVGIAPSAAASQELKGAGAHDTRTLASLLASKPADTDVSRLYILDEAGMVSGRDMDALLQRLEAEGARVLLVGDPRQLAAVEAGSPFQQMLETQAIRHATIDEIQRQRDPQLRAIAQAFARGEAFKATQLARPYMHEVEAQKEGAKPTTQEKRAAIARAAADDYLKRDVDSRAKTLVVSGTNALRRQINTRIREGLQEQGVVSRETVTVTALDKAGLTREAQTHAESYRPGMVVRLEEGHGRDRHSVEYEVRAVKGNTVTVTNRAGESRDWNPARERPAGVYQPRAMELSPGDALVFRENQKGVDRIRNGEAATIDRIEAGIPIARLASGHEIALDPSRGQTVDYGWCRTIHASQGATVDHVIIAGESARTATAQTAYVAASRERDTLSIYTDDPEKLQKAWAQTAAREHAVTVTQQSAVPDLQSIKTLRAQAAQALGRAGDLAQAREPVQTPVSPTPPSAPEWEIER